MSFEITLKLSNKDYPMLQTIKKKDIDKLALDIFRTGYMIYFPNKDKTLEKQEYEELRNSIVALREEIADSDLTDIGDIIVSKINEKIEPLNNSLSKLLGLQTASCKKGELGENIIQNAFTTRYGDILYEDKSHVAHSGDAWLFLPDGKVVMVESKNYTNTINKNEIEKMEYDMKHNNIRFCLFLSLNAPIQGFRDMDFHTFTHNGDMYFAIMVSNLTNNISKLDLAFNMIRKLIEIMNTPDKFPWIQKKIHEGLNRVNEIIAKNYLLRDNFYTMEKSIYSAMDVYHKDLRNFQYELEETIKSLTDEINSTMVESVQKKKTVKDIMIKHKDKKIYSVVAHISDLIEKKKWEVKTTDDNKYDLYNKGQKIGHFEVQLKKAKINFISNQLELTFNAGSSKINNQNLKIIETSL
jgi:hypothetical protein